MSDQPQPSTSNSLDLSGLRLMPDWVANFGTATPRPHADHDDESSGDRRDRRGGGDKRFSRDDRSGPPRRDARGGPGGDRPRGPGGPGGRPSFDRRDSRPARPVDDRPQIPTGIKVTVEPEDKAIDALSQHVKSQGRAFSLFDAARLVLAGPERHRVKVECEPERLVGLFKVVSDGALFETREEAVRYLLRSPEASAAYYSMEEVEVEEPKGVFTNVAVCGMSGEVLGPTSHHSYQTSLKRLHNERFAHMPFEEYRRRVRVESSPELIEKWKEQQRKATRWTWLKGEVVEGQEPVSFTSRADYEAHFRRVHGEELVQEVREAVVHATAKREQLSPGLGRLLRRHIEEAKKHLFELSQKIAHGLDRRGLKLFKRRGGKMFVSRVKPRAVDPGVVFTPRIAQIVEHIRATPGIQTAKLAEELAPGAKLEDLSAPVGEAAAEGDAPARQLTEEQKGLLVDLHWLADEGYVIAYSDGALFLGVQGEPPHHSPEAKAAKSKTAESDTSEGAAVAEGSEASTEAAEPVVEAASEPPAPAEPEAPASAQPEAPAEEPAPAAKEDPLPTPEEEAAAAEAAEASGADANPSGAD